MNQFIEQIPIEYHQYLLSGIIILPMSFFLVKYDNNDLCKKCLDTTRSTNTLHKRTGPNPFTQSQTNQIVNQIWPYLRVFYNINANYPYVDNSFSVSYSNKNKSQNKSLDKHTDDSLITFNICLDNTSTNNEIIFYGFQENYYYDQTFGNYHKNTFKKMQHIIKPQNGFCIIHFGKHEHEVKECSAGSRTNVVLWIKDDNI